jgi:acyl-ACP thioesterase
VFSQKFVITPAHVDCFGRAKASSLLYFAQEAAGGHCRELGVDWETLAKQGLFWAVLRYRVQITRLPTTGQTITVETWPMPTTRSAFPRSTVAYDEAGNELFRTLGLWVLMDAENRTMRLPGKSGIDLAGTLRGNELATPSNLHLQTLGSHMLRRVGYSELDRNGHMNNTRYMDWVDDLLPSAFHEGHTPREITVCYLSEAREGQELQLHWDFPEDRCLQVDAHRRKGETGDLERVFAARIQY